LQLKKRGRKVTLKICKSGELKKREMNLIIKAEKFKKLPATAHLLRMVRNPKNIVVVR
jgi:hypothetical protein